MVTSFVGWDASPEQVYLHPKKNLGLTLPGRPALHSPASPISILVCFGSQCHAECHVPPSCFKSLQRSFPTLLRQTRTPLPPLAELWLSSFLSPGDNDLRLISATWPMALVLILPGSHSLCSAERVTAIKLSDLAFSPALLHQPHFLDSLTLSPSPIPGVSFSLSWGDCLLHAFPESDAPASL